MTAAAQPSTGGFIQADPATNSLVITAPEPLYKQVRALIDQLDTRRAQVYIESMIVEVAPTDAADDRKTYLEKRTPKPLRPNQMNFPQNFPKWFTSLQKAWYGAAATDKNDYGYDRLA